MAKVKPTDRPKPDRELSPEEERSIQGGDAGAMQRGSMSEGDLAAYVDRREQELGTLGDDAQLANLDLQNTLQKQQQTLSLMSSISKSMHDTAMSILRKIGG